MAVVRRRFIVTSKGEYKTKKGKKEPGMRSERTKKTVEKEKLVFLARFYICTEHTVPTLTYSIHAKTKGMPFEKKELQRMKKERPTFSE